MSDVLLDSHVALWVLADDPLLGPRARALISSADSVMVSAASVWELEIKQQLGRLRLPEGWTAALTEAGFTELPISWADAAAATRTPLAHRDPFDRMIVAQSVNRGLTLLTADAKILQSDAPRTTDARR